MKCGMKIFSSANYAGQDLGEGSLYGIELFLNSMLLYSLLLLRVMIGTISWRQNFELSPMCSMAFFSWTLVTAVVSSPAMQGWLLFMSSHQFFSKIFILLIPKTFTEPTMGLDLDSLYVLEIFHNEQKWLSLSLIYQSPTTPRMWCWEWRRWLTDNVHAQIYKQMQSLPLEWTVAGRKRNWFTYLVSPLSQAHYLTIFPQIL